MASLLGARAFVEGRHAPEIAVGFDLYPTVVPPERRPRSHSFGGFASYSLRAAASEAASRRSRGGAAREAELADEHVGRMDSWEGARASRRTHTHKDYEDEDVTSCAIAEGATFAMDWPDTGSEYEDAPPSANVLPVTFVLRASTWPASGTVANPSADESHGDCAAPAVDDGDGPQSTPETPPSLVGVGDKQSGRRNANTAVRRVQEGEHRRVARNKTALEVPCGYDDDTACAAEKQPVLGAPAARSTCRWPAEKLGAVWPAACRRTVDEWLNRDSEREEAESSKVASDFAAAGDVGGMPAAPKHARRISLVSAIPAERTHSNGQVEVALSLAGRVVPAGMLPACPRGVIHLGEILTSLGGGAAGSARAPPVAESLSSAAPQPEGGAPRWAQRASPTDLAAKALRDVRGLDPRAPAAETSDAKAHPKHLVADAGHMTQDHLQPPPEQRQRAGPHGAGPEVQQNQRRQQQMIQKQQPQRLQPPARRVARSGGATTMILRNLPTSCNTGALCGELYAAGFDGKFDFCYVPCNFSTGECSGFGFVNLTSPAAATKFRSAWHGRTTFQDTALLVGINVCPSRVQGKHANLEAWNGLHRRGVRSGALRPFVSGG